MSLVIINISGQPVESSTAEANNNNIERGDWTQSQARDRIVCLSATGNGYNWAATLTWAAEILRDAVDTAPQNARFNLACVSGASSGSAFVATYGSLLQNKQLFSRADFHPQNATREEVLILSKSLLYMALAADFPPEVAKFYTSPDGDSQPNPPWWKSQFSLERVMLDFGTRVMLAQHISLADINQINRLDRFIRYHSLAELETAAENKEIREEYRRVTFDIWSQSQAILNRLYQNANYPRTARREDRDDFRNNPNHPVRKALAKQPPDGILALTYAELAFTKSTVDYQKMRYQAPPVETLVPFVFTNEATAKKIIKAPFYQEQIRKQDPIEKHRAHLPVLMERYQKHDTNHGISWQPIFVDHEVRFFSENQNFIAAIISTIDDIIKLGFNQMPVAMIQQSNYLLARTMNVVRTTLGANTTRGSIYDRSYQESFYRIERK